MNIFRQTLSTVTFDDVAAFCAEGVPEGLHLDYKRERPADLAKTVAAFANSHGGLIILGVDEDKNTGKPSSWPGLPEKAQEVESLHQVVSRLDPIAQCEVAMTNPDSSGNVFYLVRVLEGGVGPYYRINDSNLYVRTGNIGKPIEQAQPQQVQLLFNKRAVAEEKRNQNRRMAHDIFVADVRRAARSGRAQGQPQGLAFFNGDSIPTTSNAPAIDLIEVTVQPLLPSTAFIAPMDLRRLMDRFRFNGNSVIFPWYGEKPTPAGIVITELEQGKRISQHQQIFANGFVLHAGQVLRPFDQMGKKLYI